MQVLENILKIYSLGSLNLILRGWPAMMMHNRQQRHLTSMSFWEPLSYKLKQKLISSIDRWTVRISMSYPFKKMINMWWHKAHACTLTSNMSAKSWKFLFSALSRSVHEFLLHSCYVGFCEKKKKNCIG